MSGRQQITTEVKNEHFNGVEVNFFLDQMDQLHRISVQRIISRSFPSLSGPDLDDVWIDVLGALWRPFLEGRLQEEPNEVFAFVLQIAKRRAIDHVRKRTRYGKVMEAARADLQDSGLGRFVEQLQPIEVEELRTAITNAISALPHKQRIVLQEFIELYPQTKSHLFLYEQVKKKLGGQPTHKSVSRALEEGRWKIGKILKQVGYAA